MTPFSDIDLYLRGGMSANTPTSSSTPVCCHCHEAKQTLKYVLPVPGGKKEFCSESCLTGYRKAASTTAAAANRDTDSPLSNGMMTGKNQSGNAVMQEEDNANTGVSGEYAVINDHFI